LQDEIAKKDEAFVMLDSLIADHKIEGNDLRTRFKTCIDEARGIYAPVEKKLPEPAAPVDPSKPLPKIMV
jgi:hypothetical protein